MPQIDSDPSQNHVDVEFGTRNGSDDFDIHVMPSEVKHLFVALCALYRLYDARYKLPYSINFLGGNVLTSIRVIENLLNVENLTLSPNNEQGFLF